MEQIREFNITISKDKIQKNKVDLDLINKMDLNISINDYDYGVLDESDLALIGDYLKENTLRSFYYTLINRMVVKNATADY